MDTMSDCDFPELVPRDKLDAHHRQQLSAMLDGELPPDQAKFMLRRLQHDAQLATCWERWQVCGDVLRGRHEALLPADFSQRVMGAIARDVADAGGSKQPDAGSTRQLSRWLRWGGGALAASVALMALIVARPMGSSSADDANPVAAAAAQPATAETDAAVARLSLSATEADASTSMDAAAGQPIVPAPATPDRAAQVAAGGLAAVALTRQGARRAGERTARSQSQRAGLRLRTGTADSEPQSMLASASAHAARAANTETILVASGAVVMPAMASISNDPFAAQPVAPARPWPRAVLPDYGAGGAFTASFGSDASAAFHPFEPQVVPADAVGSNTIESEASSPRDDSDARGPR